VLAAACDLRIAAADTRFAIPEVDLGIPLAWGGITRLVREIGPALTEELVMSCRPFDAAEAHARPASSTGSSPPRSSMGGRGARCAARSEPKLALLSTKRHTNAVTEQMVGPARSCSGAEGLLAGPRDPEGNESAARYLARLRDEGTGS
jgi:hypothetical protein